jgi:hypothetical protein
VNSDAILEARPAVTPTLLCLDLQRALHSDRGGHGTPGRLLEAKGGTEDCHDTVTQEVAYEPVMGLHGFAHVSHAHSSQLEDLFLINLLTQSRRALGICEQDRDGSPLAIAGGPAQLLSAPVAVSGSRSILGSAFSAAHRRIVPP